jgi:hypothetical protein
MDNNSFDFGFTLVDESELEAVQNASTVVESTVQELATVQDRLDAMLDMIQPLLNNLASGMDKDYIYWPANTRMTKIEEFSDRLRNVYSGGNS